MHKVEIMGTIYSVDLTKEKKMETLPHRTVQYRNDKPGELS